MSTTRALQPAFTLEALSSFERAMDDVLTELLADGVLSNHDVDEARTRLAQKLMRFASSGRSVIQIRQLLSRALRNEQSSARHRISGSRRPAGLAAAKYSRDVNETLRPPVTAQSAK